MPSAVQNVNTTNGISTYPNPCSGVLHVKTANEEMIKMYDLSGRIIYNGRTVNGDIDMQNMPSGNYILTIGEESTIIHKN